jgi:FMN phosphatase YigB (HAD superfamily)
VNAAVVFDLGKVLVDFDYNIAIPRIAARSTLPPAEVKRFFFQSHLLVDYESGRLTRRELFEAVCKVINFSRNN